MKIEKKMLVNLGYISLFFIHLKLLPFSLETQPIIILFCAVAILVFNFIKRRIFYNHTDLLIYIYVFFLFIRFIIDMFLGESNIVVTLIQVVRYLIPVIIYIGYRRNIDKINFNYLKIVSNIFLGIALIISLKLPILYVIVKKFYIIFLGRFLGDISGIRGISILTPEPSYFYSIFILYFLSTDYYSITNKDKKINFKFDRIKILICAVLTKSGYVYGLIAIYYFLGIIELKKLKEIIMVIIGTVIILTAGYTIKNKVNTTRIFHIVQSLRGNKSNETLIERLYYGDASSGARFFSNFLGYSVIKKYPLGIGLNKFEETLPEKAKALGFDIERQKHYQSTKMLTGSYSLGPQTYFSSIVAEIGLFSLPLFFTILKSICRKTKVNKNVKLKVFLFRANIYIILILFLVQGQISNPIPWIIICFVENIKNKKNIINQTNGENKDGENKDISNSTCL